MNRYLVHTAVLCLAAATSVHAASLKISMAIRETGPPAPPTLPVPFANGGATGGIEWVNRDGQTLNLDGTWQLFTFTPEVDPLTAFAGTTANSMLEPGLEWATLEHIRILNSDGIAKPIRLWIDDVSNTDISGTSNFNFDASALGAEVMFQEPSFSGSTSANVAPGSVSAVSDAMAFSGSQSYQVDFQFVDGTPTRWVRLTTFSTPNTPNPLVHVAQTAFDPTITFYIKGLTIPEPSTVALASLALVGMAVAARRKLLA